MLKYTICFIKQGSKILLINREFPSWMGMWNGIGGKLDMGESPRESVIREIKEETGLTVSNPIFKGIISWLVDGSDVGGMYTYFIELPNNISYEIPIKTEEGILDWKEFDWIMNPKNKGIATNIPKSLRELVFDDAVYEHQCIYQDGKLVVHKSMRISHEYELLDNKIKVEEEIVGRYLEEGTGIR